METQKNILSEQSGREQALAGLPGDEQGILLAEDSEKQNLLIHQAFKAAGMANGLHVVSDGETAINYLSGSGSYGNRLAHPMPKVVLLNLDLPRKNGFEVLGWMRTQSHFKSWITVLFTGANHEAEADLAHAMGADFYLTKPNTFDDLVKMTRCLYGWVLGNHSWAKTDNHSSIAS